MQRVTVLCGRIQMHRVTVLCARTQITLLYGRTYTWVKILVQYSFIIKLISGYFPI